MMFGDHDCKHHKELLEIMVKGGCVRAKAWLYSKRLLWHPALMPSYLCSVGECILSIIANIVGLQTSQQPGYRAQPGEDSEFMIWLYEEKNGSRSHPHSSTFHQIAF